MEEAWASAPRAVVLHLAAATAVAIRLIPAMRFGPVLSKTASYRNFRATEYMAAEGLAGFSDWHDERAGHPTGVAMAVADTMPAGLPFVTSWVHAAVHAAGLSPDLYHTAVFIGPALAAVTVLLTYRLGTAITTPNAGLAAAVLIAAVPGYAAPSMAGAFDQEAVAPTAVVLVYFAYVTAMRERSQAWAVVAGLGYYGLAGCWHMHAVVNHVVALHALVLLLADMLDSGGYVVYSTFFVLGNLLAAQHRPIGTDALFAPTMFGCNTVFVAVQAAVLFGVVGTTPGGAPAHRPARSTAGPPLPSSTVAGIATPRLFVGLVLVLVGAAFGAGGQLRAAATMLSSLSALELDQLTPTPTLFSSGAEQQPSSWASFFYDMHILMVLVPMGASVCLKRLTNTTAFALSCTAVSLVYAGLQVRMMVTFAIPAAVLGGIAVATTLERQCRNAGLAGAVEPPSRSKKKAVASGKYSADDAALIRGTGLAATAVVIGMLAMYAGHCYWLISSAYSSPSIFLTAKNADGSLYIFDDFRESYAWLNEHTPPDARVLSWWDYGPQIAMLGNRTVLADSATGNVAQLAKIGQALALPEEKAIPIIRELDATHVLVVFGGYAGYGSDDLNKFTWMLRIAGDDDSARGRSIKEADYANVAGVFRVDRGATPAMRSSLLYKLSYHRFGTVHTDPGQPPGYDRVRRTAFGDKDFTLDGFDEVYTSKHWLVRIYKVRPAPNRQA